jgi:hypothetical protein
MEWECDRIMPAIVNGALRVLEPKQYARTRDAMCAQIILKYFASRLRARNFDLQRFVTRYVYYFDGEF